MKISHTQDQAYLQECLDFHERRLTEIAYQPVWERRTFRLYHAKQVKWFKAKLRAPLIAKPNLSSAIEVQTRYEERLSLYQSQATNFNPQLVEAVDNALSKPAPQTFLRKLWNKVRGL